MPQDQAGEIIRDLGGGLVLRRAGAGDIDAVASFNSVIHKDPGQEEPDEPTAAWTRDLMIGTHPTTSASDFLVVEDSASGAVVSSLNLISQRWTYDGIEFGVGRPEAVGTSPEYRRRGLVRAMVEVVHQWSLERGELVQVITGIPWYYRQFGYDLALNLGGGRAGFASGAPKLKEGEIEQYALKPAEDADIPFMQEMYSQACARSLVSCVIDEQTWSYMLHGLSDLNFTRLDWKIIQASNGEPAGLCGIRPKLWDTALPVMFYEVKKGVPWTAVTPGVMRALWAEGEKIKEAGKQLTQVYMRLGAEHPSYDILHSALPEPRKPYAFYVRVPDVPAFIEKIKPALERRIERSPLAGYTGELKLNFYTEGVRLEMKDGHITSVEAWKPDQPGDGDAAFPNFTFLQPLFGYRSLEELEHAYVDCWVSNDTTRAVVETLFPKQQSHVWPLE
ncbi:MAG TPA: GNAT family N-acetyltransferase [Chloroflexia bacterium]|nr:GNAT family N-acetyltransferase [Chloroflexia bacterium]